MQRNFKLWITVLIAAASSLGAVAQTEKDVVLDGKPAKLNVKTGEVKLVDLKTIKGRKTDSDTTANTVIKANLITNSYTTKKVDSTKIITTTRPDTLSQSYTTVIDTSDQVKTARLLVTSENATTIDDLAVEDNLNEVKTTTAHQAEKATTLVYDTSSTSNTEEKNSSDYHKVAKGETLYSLSKLYKVTLADLKKANNLETTLIKVGQYLQVKNFDKRYSSEVWIVSKGDTLYSIAKRNNTTVAAIKTLNGLHSNLIIPGQKIQLK
ncbi:LysM peptidoglycan-binding domain-containing protein [Psychroserpens sp. SPM9]|uniref:LysM peptidoglycan-binding domain-containing protein n=1 Tax=Psychroserpens sp. SPM9 TaxID=2975598 RepID=UPI0021A7B102|nr:LysM peptidoglycan-binding domain-containing protein [Psychroserpens sp. SPM9]MDG5491437.1 LysM peptidoglycan-binding domain-containing protein [Psychroserpens sp. SPM9]